MFINIHVIQTVPSNNLNRDDTAGIPPLVNGLLLLYNRKENPRERE